MRHIRVPTPSSRRVATWSDVAHEARSHLSRTTREGNTRCRGDHPKLSVPSVCRLVVIRALRAIFDVLRSWLGGLLAPPDVVVCGLLRALREYTEPLFPAGLLPVFAARLELG